MKLNEIRNKKIIDDLNATLETENALNEKISNLILKNELIQKELRHEQLLKLNLETELHYLKSSTQYYDSISDNKTSSVCFKY